MDERTPVEETLHAFCPQVRLGDRLGGGNRNEVRGGLLRGERVVVRRSRRTVPSLAWEFDLLVALDRAGFIVPTPIPADTGALHHEGVCVLTWLDGDPPASDGDWRAVATTLRRVHALTERWPQRPGFAGTRELLLVDFGGDVDLRAMPPEAVPVCRSAWSAIAAEPRSVVHGDPGAANVRICRGGAGLIDWDEARVDASVLDLAEHPLAPGLVHPPERLAAAHAAATAWEAANGWLVEPEYARRKLADLERLSEPLAPP